MRKSGGSAHGNCASSYQLHSKTIHNNLKTIARPPRTDAHKQKYKIWKERRD